MRRAGIAVGSLVLAVLTDAAPAFAQSTGKEPAGGAAIGEAIGATAGALVATALVIYLIAGHRSGRIKLLDRIGSWAERQTGLPAWASVPSMLLGFSLLTAVLGMYWDISLHIDNGRDAGPLANPAHYLILIGLYGVLVAGVLSIALCRHRAPGEDGDPPRRRLVGARRRPDDGRLRRVRAHRLPARRHVAPAVRPGRDALGPDPPDADRRRVARDARRHGADGRGDHDDRPRPRARGHAVGLPRAPRAAGRRLPRRAHDLPGRVRLRRAAVPRRLPADPDHARGRHRPRDHAALPRPRRRAARGARLHR